MTGQELYEYFKRARIAVPGADKCGDWADLYDDERDVYDVVAALLQAPAPAGINALAEDAATIRVANGFYTPDGINGPLFSTDLARISKAHLMLASLAFVCREVVDAMEAAHKGDEPGFAAELAEVVIRVLDIAGTCGIDLEVAIARRLADQRATLAKHGRNHERRRSRADRG